MQSVKGLKNRIQSVKNTQQTTKAMKMVSAAKLRRAHEAILSQRPYAFGLLGLTRKVAAYTSLEGFDFIQTQEGQDQVHKKTVLLVAITLDRGLCGGFNANVIKKVQQFIHENKSYYHAIQLAVIGKKGYAFFQKEKFQNLIYFPEFSGKVSLTKAQALSENLLERYASGEVTEVKFVYNEFVNALSQQILVENFLPLVPHFDTSEAEKNRYLLIEPSPRKVLVSLMQKNFHMQVLRILLESQAGEHGARMSAMDNATKNAGEMIEHLSLLYNKQRQASITRELLEIVAGCESQQKA